jgi:cytochrome c oxidase assembly protein Cox11
VAAAKNPQRNSTETMSIFNITPPQYLKVSCLQIAAECFLFHGKKLQQKGKANIFINYFLFSRAIV